MYMYRKIKVSVGMIPDWKLFLPTGHHVLKQELDKVV